ncbi:unnamed protein product [Closterium sp. NIES-54]
MFAPGPLLHPNGTKVRSATHPRNCTVCLEAALSHRPFPLLEPGTNRYAKLEKVYSDFLNVGHCGMNDEMYTLTFVNAGTRYVWIVNVEVRSKAYEVFRLLLAHAQRQSGEKLKIWQSDGAAEFRSKEMKDYLAKKGIKHHVSLPYTHQQQGIAEHTNRTLMTKVRALMKQSKLPPTYWTYAMHHAVRVHNMLSTTAISGNSSPHVKWTGTKGNTSILRVNDACGCSHVLQYQTSRPREWHDTLRTTLAALGFAPFTADPSLFLHTDTSLPSFYVLVYVEDLVFATAVTGALTLVKSKLQKR